MRNFRKTRKRGGVEFTKVYDCPFVKGGKKKAAKSTCIKEFTTSNKFTIIKTADDGNCFYDTLSKFGSNKGFAPLNKPHLVLRQMVVRKLLDNIDEIAPYFVSNSGSPLSRRRIEEEIRELGKPDVWDSNGGDIVIQYASTVFGVKISIYDVKDSDPRDVINRIVFSPTGANSSITNVNMLRVNDSHYMLLIPTEGPEAGILPKGKKTVMSRRSTKKSITKNKSSSNSNSNNSLANALEKIAIMESSFVATK